MPFDETEAHYVEATFYDELAPAMGSRVTKPTGIPLPRWESIKDDHEWDLRQMLDQKRQKRSGESIPRCHKTTLPDGKVVYRL